jgi:hypothetical protein
MATRLDGIINGLGSILNPNEEEDNLKNMMGLLSLDTNSQGISLQNSDFEGNFNYERNVDRALASRNSLNFGTALPEIPNARSIVGEFNPNFDKLDAASDTADMLDVNYSMEDNDSTIKPTPLSDTITPKNPTDTLPITNTATISDMYNRITDTVKKTELITEDARKTVATIEQLTPEAKPDFFNKLFNDRERMLYLALAFNTMRLDPDDGLTKVIGSELKDLRKNGVTNKTYEYLKKTRPDLYNLVKDGSMTIKEAVSVLNLDKFSGNISLPTMPKDYQGKWDPKTNSFSMSIIPGSKTETDMIESTKRKESKKSGKIGKTSMMNTNIDQALAIIDTKDWATGIKGAFVRDYGGIFGAGSPAINLQATMTSIQANIGFDRLQQMREESPTGGALGQVAVQELVALQSTLGSLDLRQDPKFIKKTLEHVRSNYNRIIFEAYGQEILDKYGFSGGTTGEDDPLGIR